MADDNAARAFIASKGAKLPQRAPRRRKGIRQVSEKRAENLRTWAAIKQRKLAEQRDAKGKNWCEECGVDRPQRLDLDHIIPASSGGSWTYDNAQLICAGPGSCHERKHGTPWPRGATS